MRESREISLVYDCDGVTTPESREKRPVFPNLRKISRLLEAVAALAVFSCSMIPPLEMTIEPGESVMR